MGFIAKIIQIIDKKLKIDPGGGDISTVDRYSSAGDDSKPLDTDFVAGIEINRTGGHVVVAFYDPKNPAKSSKGDKRIYSRDPDSGAEKAEIWLKNTGEIVIKNAVSEFNMNTSGSIKGNNALGAFELLPNGNFVANDVIMKPGGVIETTAITINGIPFAAHVHGGVTVGAGVTGVPQ
jgi:hypothetical protein